MPTAIASPLQPKETYRARLHQQFVTLHGSKRGVAAGEYFVLPRRARVVRRACRPRDVRAVS